MTKTKTIWASTKSLKLIAAATAAVLGVLLVLASTAAGESSSSDLATQIENQRREVDANRQEIADLNARIAGAQQYLDQRRLELADASSMLRSSEDRYNETLRLYEGRISAIYKLGDASMYAVVLSSEDFSDGLARISYLSRVSENDQRLVAQVKAEADEVRLMHEKVDTLKQAQAEDVNVLNARKQQLEGKIATGTVSIEKQTQELAQVRQKEELDRLAQETANDSGNIFLGNMGAPLIVSNTPPAGLQPTGITLNGMASWYGPGFQGNTTANGEIYNMYGYTAAHKSRPINSWLKVTHGGRSVFVRINDRGPYVGGRILDLSFSSAQAIGISGVGYVNAEIYR